MKTDPCEKPNCRWHETCVLRPPATPAGREFLHPANRQDSLIYGADHAAAVFVCRMDVAPAVGELTLTGHLSEGGIAEAVAEASTELGGLAGLLVSINSSGGRGPAGDQIGTLIADAARTIPVVTFARRACSAALGPFLAGSVRLCSPDTTIGGYGSTVVFCDGHEPGVLLNRQSPQKRLTPDRRPWLWAGDGEAVFNILTWLDRDFEAYLAKVSNHVNMPPTRLRPLLDGRTLTAEQAVAAGLAHGLAKTEGDAFSCLLDLAYSRATTHNGRTNT